MAERGRYNPYQLYFDLSGRPQEVARHVHKLQEHIPARSPADIAGYLMQHIYTPFETFTQEELWVLLLNARNSITHQAMIYRGTINTIHVRVAELYRSAVRENAASIVLSHCHPTGDPEPSYEDVRVTSMAHEAGQLLDITLLDHIIVGNAAWVSLKEKGLGFT